MANKHRAGKLAVILHADIAGSTQLVHMDEHLAHERIQETFHRIGETITKYHGYVRELRGDALLAEFERASDAVSAALAFQGQQADYISGLIDAIRPTVRVGIAMGEVVIADNTITGAGVVLAQRLEQLAESGGVCIQGAAYETIPKRLPFEYENLDEHKLKGFDDPVRIYRVELSPGESIPLPKSPAKRKRRRRYLVPIIALAVGAMALAIGTTYLFHLTEVTEEPASIERMAFPLPDKPSIAVLPFTNMSGDAEQEYFVDGMTEDLITDLSKISGLFVIARNSSFSYKGQQVKVRQVAEELGVRYVLEGSVRRAGEQVRINAQLIDATTGGHLWAERYDGSLSDIFALQDQVTKQIVNAMSLTLTPQELEDLESLGTSNVAAHDSFLQGLSFYLRNTPADNAKAEKHFIHAVNLDPEFKRVYAALANVYYKSYMPEYSIAIGIFWQKAIFLANKNIAKTEGARISDAHVVRARMAIFKHQVDVAFQESELALELNSNDTEALKIKALALIFAGQYSEGRKLAYQALRLDPTVIDEQLYIIGLSYFASGDYKKSVEFLQRAIEIDPNTNEYPRLLAAAYGKLGMESEAKQALAKFQKLWRVNYWVSLAVYLYPFVDGEVLERLADGFEAAGTAVRPPVRYFKFNRENRLTGPEIRALIFGHKIKGIVYLGGLIAWEQTRTVDGKVFHTGVSAHSGIQDAEEQGEGQIVNDRLCDKWSLTGGSITNCVSIFRASNEDEFDYYMVTDLGPYPFRVIN